MLWSKVNYSRFDKLINYVNKWKKIFYSTKIELFIRI